MYRCPVCGSAEVRRGKYCVGHDANDRDINAYDFYCHRCRTLQQKAENEPDFQEWVATWSASAPR